MMSGGAPCHPLHRFYIQEFSQRGAGLQTLGAQLFTASDLPLIRADFGDNQARRRMRMRSQRRRELHLALSDVNIHDADREL